jgi:glycerophosphoryl diester phosphodiesterase
MGQFRWFFVGSLVLLASCQKAQKNINVLVFGHAGTGLENLSTPYHANSREAVNYALSIEGCDGVEVDIQVDIEGRLWLFHDTTLEETTNGVGCIPTLLTSEVNGLTYKSVNRESLIRLSQLDRKRLEGKTLFLDIRHYNHCTQQLCSVQSVIDELLTLDYIHPNGFQTYAILLTPSWIQPFHLAGMNVLLHLTTFEDVVQAINEYPMLTGFVLKNNDFSAEEVKEIHQLSKKVYLFEMRSAKSIREAFHKKPDGVITDDILSTIIEKY